MAIDIENYKKTGSKRGKRYSSPMIPDDVVMRVVERVAAGEGVRALAKEYGVSKSTVSDWVNGHTRTDVTGGSLYDILSR